MRAHEFISESLRWNTHDNEYDRVDRSDYTLVVANIKDIFDHTGADQRISVTAQTKADDENIIGDRVQQAKRYWQEGGSMDLSIVGWSEHFNNIYFSNGRHRLVAAYQLGERYAPVLVDNEAVEKFTELVRTK